MAEQEQAGQAAPDSGDWAIFVATQGVEPMLGKGRGGPKVNVTGLYRGKVTKTSTIISNEKQEPWVLFECTITRAPKAGQQFVGATQNVLLPAKPEMKNFDRKWKTAALNVAKDPAKLEQPGFKLRLTPKTFIDKDVWIYIQAAPEGKKNAAGYDADPFANFATPAEAAELAAEEEKATGGAGAGAAQKPAAVATGGNGTTPAPTPPAAPAGEQFATLD